jgi:transposase
MKTISQPLRRSQRPPKEYNTLPKQVTREEFNCYIKPCLSKGRRGPNPNLSTFKIFNYILYVLHTGIQWANLPVKEVHWSNIYRHFNRWSKDGSLQKVFENSREFLATEDAFDLTALHGDGSNVVAKKGARASATQDTSTSGARKALILKTIPATCLSRA